MNTLAYLIYLFITWFITVQVGLVFFKNGRTFLLYLFGNDVAKTTAINKLLLTGYYLLNGGYAAVMLQTWETIDTWTALLVSICSMVGRIILTLALIHFFNMLVLFLLSKWVHSSIHHKTYSHDKVV